MAGVFPRAVERARLQLSAEPAEPPPQADDHPAEWVQQQAPHAEEPPGGDAAGEPQTCTPMTTPRLIKSHFFFSSSSSTPAYVFIFFMFLV